MDLLWNKVRTHLESGLQMFAVSISLYLVLGEAISIFIFIRLLFSDYFWWPTILYLFYLLFSIGREEQGGLSSKWVRNSIYAKYFCNYFPINLVKTVDLDASRNYLFAACPHGVFGFSLFGAFAANGLSFTTIFPGMSSQFVTSAYHFLVPFNRELFFSLGFCSSSAKSILHLLDPEKYKGKCAVLAVGGLSEMLEAHPGTYKIILRKRKGFVRVAIQSGSPIVPVISFGENDLFDQVANPKDSKLRNFQEWAKKSIGFPLPIIKNLIPLSKSVTVVVGKPTEVQRNPDPSAKEIDAIHEEYISKLTELFETEKKKYLKNHENVKLILAS